jgi:hypothetical protein
MNPLESVLECYFDNTARELAKNEARRGMSLADTKKGARSGRPFQSLSEAAP